MRSPFAIFRKHAKVLTVVLTGLAMFAFIVMGQIRTNPYLFPIIMGALLLGGAFWILGRPSGNSTEYSMVGLILGVLLMVYVVPYFNRPPAAVELSIGSLSQTELHNHVSRMQLANQFVQRAMNATGQRTTRGPFSYGGLGEDKETYDAIVAYILNHEADQMGIGMGDDAVNEFLTSVTGGNLSQAQFRKIRSSMGLSESELYDILREQLRARMAMRMLRTQEFTTPADYWQYYRRLNVKQEIAVTAVPVSAFVSAGKPDEAEVGAFFERYKTRFSRGVDSPEPGFRQPDRIRLAYLEIDYAKVRRQAERQTPVTDADVEAFYEKNKDIRYRELPSFGDDEPPFDTPGRADEDEPIDPVIAPDPPQPKQNGTGEPDPRSNGAAKDESEESNESANNAADESGLPSKNGPAQFSVQDDASSAAAGDVGESPVEAPVPVDPDAPVEAPDPPPPVKYLPLDEELKAEIREELLRDLTLPLVTKIRDKAQNFLRDVDDDYNAKLDHIKSSTPEDSPERAEKTAELAKAIAGRVRRFAKQNDLRFVELELLSAVELVERGAKAADLWNEIQGADATPTDQDRKTLNYLIAQATQSRYPGEDARSESPSVLEVLFGPQQGERLYSPEAAQDDISQNQYVYWKIEFQKQHVPTLDEPGIRDKVVAALKQYTAREPARKRAEKLAETVRTALKQKRSMAEALAGQTVTGKPDGLELSVLDTGESFSWLTIPTAPSPNPFFPSPPRLSNISTVENPGDAFMQVVFDELDVGEVGVAPNADRSVYYVVRVEQRSASAPGGQSAFRDRFMKQEFFGTDLPPQMQALIGGRQIPTSYTQLVQREQSEAFLRWINDLLERYGYNGER